MQFYTIFRDRFTYFGNLFVAIVKADLSNKTEMYRMDQRVFVIKIFYSAQFQIFECNPNSRMILISLYVNTMITLCEVMSRSK
jgi:malate/lactate dehydrogenase